ncbi:inactive tyrosine-protein kinase PEAK1-like [Anabas testudineus]|uniref:inactive tyrosine-protein kinase PEAK1-like n=1 Tax=Anabas testudineus TaxID=64144 RepID=UPI000E45C8F2|nr:inactive tyrosine-protein kinase PEAK1-like [Anabas testudineus]
MTLRHSPSSPAAVFDQNYVLPRLEPPYQMEEAPCLRSQWVAWAQRETSEREVSPYQPQDFLLYGGSEPKLIGDTVYYSVHSPKFPGRVLGLKVHKRISADTKHNSSHVNVDDVIVYFQPSNTLRDDPIYSYGQDLSSPLKIGCTASKSPCGGSTESDKHLTNTSLPSIQSLLLQGHSVSIVRDLPHVTLEDFVLDSSSLQSTERLVYDRQLCVLLVQILTASQHLYNVSATAAELRPRDILLVWPSRERDGSENKLKQDTPEGKRVSETSRARDRMEWEKTEKKGSIQALWRTRGSARVVLTPRFSAQPEPHSLVSVKSQIAALIQHCLYSQGPTPFKSSYRSGLLYISSLLQNESTGPQMADMVAMLQVLLWGPRVPLFNLRGYTTTAVHNWLTIKRALLVMRLAEKGLIQDQSALSWDDCMCLQYLSFTDPETVVSVTSQLWLNLKVD